MKKLLIVALLGVFFICVCSVNAATTSEGMAEQAATIHAQELEAANPVVQEQKTVSQDSLMTPGMIADQAAAVYSEVLLMEKRANEYEKTGKTENAKKTWVALLEKVKYDDPFLYDRYFEFLNRTGDVSGTTIEQLKKVQKRYPDNNFYTFKIAELLAANNKKGEAKAILTKFIKETEDSEAIEDARRRLKMLDSLGPLTPASSDVSGIYTPKKQPK